MPDDAADDAGRWADDRLLDALRGHADPLADQCFAELREVLRREDFGALFARLDSNAEPLPADVPAPLRRFLEQATRVPTLDGTPVDGARLRRGQRAFMRHAFAGALVLLAKSLPEGYAAPNLSQVLALSDNLTRRPYRRLLGVLQMLINVSAVGGFEPEGKARITIPKVRLLHAGVRHLVRRHRPDYEARHGPPVNLEDMLATAMGFSYLLVCGLERLDIGLTPEEAEDFYYLWRVVAQMMGIHPPGEPDAARFVPADLAEAGVFYAAYARRHYVDAERNPEGVALARANLRMLNDLLPRTPLRRLGLGIVPRIYMEELMGREACARVGIRPVPFLYLTKWLLRHLPALWTRLWDLRDRYHPDDGLHENLSRAFFQDLIRRELGGEITFVIPDTLEELRRLAGR